MALIEYRNLVKMYKNTPALNGIDLDIPAGRIVGLLGPNGSGKTTLIKLTAGLLTPTAGTVTVDGFAPGPETKAVVAYLPERSYMSEWMTVESFISYFADFYRDFDRVKAAEMLKRLNIDQKRTLKTLSKGTKEKVQLVLVMSRGAKAYFLDEPIAGVDPAARDYARDHLSGADSRACPPRAPGDVFRARQALVPRSPGHAAAAVVQASPLSIGG